MSEAVEKAIKEWIRDHSYEDELLFVQRLRECLNAEQTLHVLNVIDSICKSCLNNDNTCQCWNDE